MRKEFSQATDTNVRISLVTSSQVVKNRLLTHDNLGDRLERVSTQIDLHGYHPADVVWNGLLAKLVEQAWEMGERELILIHGHGRNRGITPGFVNTNAGFFAMDSPYNT